MANGNYSEVAAEIQNLYDVAEGQLEAAGAICNAVKILTALERAPEHHDTHPSHNIRTGTGYAHGLRVANDTMPLLRSLKSAISLL
jgi:hypothetical protein